MEPTEQDLRKHDDWADHALSVVDQMTARQQQQMMRHIFRVVAHAQLTGDDEEPRILCGDLYSTIELHSDDDYRKAMASAGPPDRENTVNMEDALKVLADLR